MIRENCMKFGEFLKQKRIEKNLKSKTLAELLNISPAYLSSLESGSRQPPSYELLEKMAIILQLNTEERLLLFDLAAMYKQPPEIPRDLVEYIYQNPLILEILRYSKKCQLADEEWKIIFNFIRRIYKY